MQNLRFHHVGIPTSEKLPDMDYNEKLKLHSTGYFDSPYGIEWMYFDEDNNLPEIIKSIPHIAYVVDNLDKALIGKNIILEPECPTEGVTVAFFLDGHNLIELLQFDIPEEDVWPHPDKFKI
jgi:hypothetical protein